MADDDDAPGLSDVLRALGVLKVRLEQWHYSNTENPHPAKALARFIAAVNWEDQYLQERLGHATAELTTFKPKLKANPTQPYREAVLEPFSRVLEAFVKLGTDGIEGALIKALTVLRGVAESCTLQATEVIDRATAQLARVLNV
ncbi:MAG TPA: hypothetical protein VGI10_22755 [Polyangiaceae bacterium]|jgi:hypothetical protein